MKNWKTTVAGIIVGAVAAATYLKWITPEMGTAIITAATAVGLVVASDGKKAS